MRKWVVIVAAALVVGLAVCVAIFSRPKPGSVEWHRKEYLRAYNRVFGERPVDLVKRIIPGGPGNKEMGEHWEALERLGYFVDHRTSLSSNEAQVIVIAFRNATKDRFHWNFIQVRWESPVVLRAPREVIDEFDRFLRKQNLPAEPKTTNDEEMTRPGY